MANKWCIYCKPALNLKYNASSKKVDCRKFAVASKIFVFIAYLDVSSILFEFCCVCVLNFLMDSFGMRKMRKRL